MKLEFDYRPKPCPDGLYVNYRLYALLQESKQPPPVEIYPVVYLKHNQAILIKDDKVTYLSIVYGDEI